MGGWIWGCWLWGGIGREMRCSGDGWCGWWGGGGYNFDLFTRRFVVPMP